MRKQNRGRNAKQQTAAKTSFHRMSKAIHRNRKDGKQFHLVMVYIHLGTPDCALNTLNEVIESWEI